MTLRVHVSNDGIGVSVGKHRPIKMECGTTLDNTKVIVNDAVRGFRLESADALMHVQLLEEEKVHVEERVTCLEGELVEVSFRVAAVNDTNDKLEQRVRAVERVNALLTDRMNEACFDLNQQKQQQCVELQPPTYHDQNLLSVNQCYKEEISHSSGGIIPCWQGRLEPCKNIHKGNVQTCHL